MFNFDLESNLKSLQFRSPKQRKETRPLTYQTTAGAVVAHAAHRLGAGVQRLALLMLHLLDDDALPEGARNQRVCGEQQKERQREQHNDQIDVEAALVRHIGGPLFAAFVVTCDGGDGVKLAINGRDDGT